MSKTSRLRWLRAPFDAAALLTGAKSFRDNPVLGNQRLNERGLHVMRKRLAHRMADSRRSRLRHLVTDEDAAALERDGFIVKTNFLPADVFDRLKAQALGAPAPARDTRQGDTITRRIPIDAAGARCLPAVAALARDPRLLGLVRYVGASKLKPFVFVQTIFSQVYAVEPDPQTELHADTFHPSVKAWLFLNDVPRDEGAFVYVPGSHRPTPKRLEWEKKTSIAASQGADFLTERGSFRIGREELAGIDLPQPRIFDVPANTLVVADTSGFHARGLSARPSVRSEIFLYGRRSPFLPWTGLDPASLPPIAAFGMRASWAIGDLVQKKTRKWNPWQDAGSVTALTAPEILIHFDLEAVRREEEARATFLKG